MIDFAWQFIDLTKQLATAVKDQTFKNLSHLAATLRKDAQASIEISPLPSRPGSPPHSRDGRLARAIVFDVDKQNDIAVIGPRESIIGDAGHALEFADPIGPEMFEERPFMGPTQDRNLYRYGDSFESLI